LTIWALPARVSFGGLGGIGVSQGDFVLAVQIRAQHDILELFLTSV
jgi:hypothetical protein